MATKRRTKAEADRMLEERVRRIESKLPQLATKKQLRDSQELTNHRLGLLEAGQEQNTQILEVLVANDEKQNKILADQNRALTTLAKESHEQLVFLRAQAESSKRLEAMLMKDEDIRNAVYPPGKDGTAELDVKEEVPDPHATPTHPTGDVV